MGWLAALAGLASPILARVLIALGFSVVTITGAVAVLGTLKSQLLDMLGTAPSGALMLAGLGGAWVGLGMVLGACTFAVSVWGLTKAVKIGAGG
jgi:hypothetical protein